jgi:hypothetical protein
MSVTTAPVSEWCIGEAAWASQAAWRRGHFGLKSAPVTAISDRERKTSI